MYRKLWEVCNESVCSLNYYTPQGIQFYRSTGFRYRNYIISDLCSEVNRKAASVMIDFCSNGHASDTESLSLPLDEVRDRISGETGRSPSGILVLPLKPDELRYVPSVEISGQPAKVPGTPIAVFSYSRQFSHLHLKAGLVSSYVPVNGISYILVECSTEQGNSGSPVFDVSTGKLVGVMTDCFSSLKEKHRKLKRIIGENIRMLEKSTGMWTFGNIDPAQVLTANQYMIKHLANEIYLSAQSNYGFAIPVNRLSGYIRNLEHRNQIEVNRGEDQDY